MKSFLFVSIRFAFVRIQQVGALRIDEATSLRILRVEDLRPRFLKCFESTLLRQLRIDQYFLWSIRTNIHSIDSKKHVFESITSKPRGSGKNHGFDPVNSEKKMGWLEKRARHITICTHHPSIRPYRFDGIDSNEGIQPEMQSWIDHNSRSTSPNAMKFSQ